MVVAGAGFTAMAQVRGGDNFYAQKLTLDLDVPVGMVMQSPTGSMPLNYTNYCYSNVDKLKFNAGLSYGLNAEVGYFVGLYGKFGIGAGINYMSQSSSAEIGNFRVDYQDKDSKGNIFRQILSSNGAIKEDLTTTNINIPIMLKYKKRFTTRLGLAVDAGFLFNVSMTNKWKADASFDYEAAYKFSEGVSSGAPTLYDNGTTLGANDWLLTRSMYTHTLTPSVSTLVGIFDSLRLRGYNVALNTKSTQNSGTVNYSSGIGFMLRPAVTVRLMPRLHAKIGAVVTYQMFKHTYDGASASDYKVSSNLGANYNSILQPITSINVTTIALNLGLRYFIGIPKDKQFDGKYDE